MGLLDKLTTQGQGSQLSTLQGETPPTMAGASDQSRLHNEYSINGNPSLGPTGVIGMPSTLDLDGLTPAQYLNNLPE